MAAREAQHGPATGRPEGAAGGPQPWLTVIVLLGTAPFLAGGIWAFLWPHSSTMHAISHLVDADLGGRASDPYTLGALALLLVTALVIRVRGSGGRHAGR
jgi:hypothetical protein